MRTQNKFLLAGLILTSACLPAYADQCDDAVKRANDAWIEKLNFIQQSTGSLFSASGRCTINAELVRRSEAHLRLTAQAERLCGSRLKTTCGSGCQQEQLEKLKQSRDEDCAAAPKEKERIASTRREIEAIKAAAVVHETNPIPAAKFACPSSDKLKAIPNVKSVVEDALGGEQIIDTDLTQSVVVACATRGDGAPQHLRLTTPFYDRATKDNLPGFYQTATRIAVETFSVPFETAHAAFRDCIRPTIPASGGRPTVGRAQVGRGPTLRWPIKRREPKRLSSPQPATALRLLTATPVCRLLTPRRQA